MDKIKFNEMSKNDLLNYCRNLYEEKGISSLTYESLSKIYGLYYNLYSNDLPQREVVKQLGVEEEFRKYKAKTFKRIVNGRIRRGWTWDRVKKEAGMVVEKEGFLPPAGWFQANGNPSLVQGVYNLGRTWEDLRNEFASFEGSSFIESRNGMRWRSHPEASMSNFLYARGIKHERGKKYPDDFKDFSESKYAYYDLHFLVSSGRWVDVEIWGEKPNGHNAKFYAKKRLYKETYNQNNPMFLGIEFRDCFDEQRLSKILIPYIGIIEPYVFDKPTDKIIQSTHWSNTDELIEYCREFASKQPGGKFPTEEWLRKRGKWSDREGDAYNTLSIYIKTWIGGIRKLRKILGQEENSTKQWTKEKAIAAYKEWYEQYDCTPNVSRSRYQEGDRNISHEESKKAASISHAALKYAGGTKVVHELLGISSYRKKLFSRQEVIEGFKEFVDKHKISPNQMIYRYEKGVRGFTKEDCKFANRLNRSLRTNGMDLKQVFVEIGFEPKKS